MFRYEIIWEKTQKTGFYNANRMPLKGHENILVFYKKLPTYNPIKRTISPQEAKERIVNIGRTRHKKADRCVLYGHVNAQDYTDTGERYPHDVIHFSNWNGALFGKTDKATKHPTQKPVALLEYLIKTYTNEGDVVLDNCMGSGSTCVACVNTNRHYIGYELSEEYFDIACKRLDDAEK
jgi:site-specific DNA-methyltransferase (adenine-specific)